MKKNTIARLQTGSKSKVNQIRRMAAEQRMTVGLDLGDRTSRYWILDEAGEKANEDQLPTTRTGLDSLFGKMPPCGAVEGIVRHVVIALPVVAAAVGEDGRCARPPSRAAAGPASRGKRALSNCRRS